MGFNLLFPLALIPLILLPIIWFISKNIPPKPKTQILPSLRFLKGIKTNKPQNFDAPLWLKILRSFAIGLIILGLASPIWQKEKAINNQNNNYIFIFENGLSGANEFEIAKNNAIKIIENNEAISKNSNQYIILQSANAQDIAPKTASNAIAILEKMQPAPFFTSDKNLLNAFAKINIKAQIFYFGDGLKHQFQNELFNKIKSFGNINYLAPSSPFFAINNVKINENSLNIQIIGNGNSAQLESYDIGNNLLSTNNISTGNNNINLGANIINKITYLKIKGQNNAGATWIINSFEKRLNIGIENIKNPDNPLLSENYYIENAAKIIGNVNSASIDELVKMRPNAIIFPDRNGFSQNEIQELINYINQGGMVIRYAGAKAASANNDILLPAKISPQIKVMNNSFSWVENTIEPFPQNSPLFGLDIDPNIQINGLVRTEESNNVDIWARLKDKSPLISAKKMGQGYIVLIHMPASSIWSNLALSKYQYEFLRRIMSKTQGQSLPVSERAPTLPLVPQIIINGNGKIEKPNENIKAIAPEDWQKASPSFLTPPGIYEGGSSLFIMNALKTDFNIEALNPPNYFKKLNIENNQFAFKPILVLFGALLLLFDMIFSSKSNLKFKKPKSFKNIGKIMGALALISLFGFEASPNISKAQNLDENSLVPWGQVLDEPPPIGSQQETKTNSTLKLAYIITNDEHINNEAKQGLEALAKAMTMRTNAEVAEVVGIHPNSDELAFYPIIYWLLPDNPQSLDEKSTKALDFYMQNGGVVFIDTKGKGKSIKASQDAVKAALNGLHVPPLEKTPQDHVLNRTFYLLHSYPSNFGDANLFIESKESSNMSANDGVSPIIIGDGEFAAVWAKFNNQSPLASRNQEELDQELAIRFGINICMYALTGQYKNDQLHIPMILQRINSNSEIQNGEQK